jgi:NADH-quinone oxidoreductase subunit C
VNTGNGAQWRDAWAAAHAAGMDHYDFLTAVDLGDRIGLIGRCWGEAGERFLRTDVTAGATESIADIFAGAAWDEREVHEMFGVAFIGAPSDAPLLLHDRPVHPPLRKATPLPQRVERPWLGAQKRAKKPGVRQEWLRDG